MGFFEESIDEAFLILFEGASEGMPLQEQFLDMRKEN